MDLKETIDIICKLPIFFAIGNKSSFILVQESGLENVLNELKPQHIQDYLQENEYLIGLWEEWSNDKRSTTGYYLNLKNEFSVGYLKSDGKVISIKTFEKAVNACAEYIYKEVISILESNKD